MRPLAGSWNALAMDVTAATAASRRRARSRGARIAPVSQHIGARQQRHVHRQRAVAVARSGHQPPVVPRADVAVHQVVVNHGGDTQAGIDGLVQRLDDLVVRHLRLPQDLARRLRRLVFEGRAAVVVRRDRAEHPHRRGVGHQRIREPLELVPPLRLGRHHRHGHALSRQRRPEKIAHERDQLRGRVDAGVPGRLVVRLVLRRDRHQRNALAAIEVANAASLFAQSARCASSSEPPLIVDAVVLPFGGRRPGRAPHLRAARRRLPRGSELGRVPGRLDLHAQQRQPDPELWREELVGQRVGDIAGRPRAGRAEAVDALIRLRQVDLDRTRRRGRPSAGRSPESKQAAADSATSAGATTNPRKALPREVIREAILTGRPGTSTARSSCSYETTKTRATSCSCPRP